MFYFSDYAIPRNISYKSKSKIENYPHMEFLRYCKFGRKKLCTFWSLDDIMSSGPKDEQNYLLVKPEPLEYLPPLPYLYF